jgi:hypothetical protein
MQNGVSCKECEAIRHELAEAYAEAWASSDQHTRDYWTAFFKLIGGTEDDAEQVEELLPKAQLREHPDVSRALRKLFIHRAQTGHLISPLSPLRGGK